MADDTEGWTSFDDEQVKMESMGLHHPLTTAFAFVNALAEPEPDVRWLSTLVTPESRPHWGDFSDAKTFYDGIHEPGFGSLVNRLPGAPDVGFFKIIPSVRDGFTVTEETPMAAAALLTLIWRPEAGSAEDPGMWLVHQLGPAAEPHELVHARTSAGTAPDF
ncbi:hypothetical protein [Rathayibacter tritici]|uniref:Uncharacterized protein n=1 Tax=Rathayibacter tritici TaxID=33888 RepID=A0A161JNM4_9MICO|nr:hypothetical protein [Rathayibacter tritici]AND15241.1 hypothetical protein A6122_0072 [Rathayibacter tritici]PPI40633.1 hypothetical protein C5D18_15070 [Rathayibacter tritici]